MIVQKFRTVLYLSGDGVATTFTFDLGRVLGLAFNDFDPFSSSGAQLPFVLVDSGAIPDGVSVDGTFPSQGTASASISRRTITVSFATAPTGDFTLQLSLNFNG